ncbi:MAG: LCP family protein, partial [Clostridia bacterium]|nr:LCP family protein [Clostridia bacterium]
MKLYGGKPSPSKKNEEAVNTVPLTPEEQAHKARLERRKKVARKRQAMLFGGIALATIAIIALLMSIFVRPPDVSTHATEPSTDSKGNVILPSEGQPSLEDEVDEDAPSDRKKDYYTFLLCGLDQDKTRADTIMAVSYDVPNGVVNVMNIPRDTIVDANRSIKKINSGFVKGIDNLKKEVKSVIGIPIDRYVIIDFDGFEEIVDAIGGVKYNVPVRMKYDDPTQDLHIDLQPGMQTLNGEKALHFVRFRKCNAGESGGYPGGDIERIQAQQEFIKAVLKQLASPTKLLQLDDIWDAVYENIETDLSLSEIVWFGMRAITINGENIHMSTMPGIDQYLFEADFGHMQSYYIP